MSVLRVSRKTDSDGGFDTSAPESRRERRPGSTGVLILVAGIVAGVGLRDTCPSALSVHICETGVVSCFIGLSMRECRRPSLRCAAAP